MGHDTSSDDKYTGFSNFCPEVSFDVFGLFAVSLHRYADEIDTESAYAKLKENAYPKDWRWQWAYVESLHYLKCPVYSQLLSTPSRIDEDSVTKQTTQDIIEIKPSFMGISLNIKELITHFAKWWLSKRKH